MFVTCGLLSDLAPSDDDGIANFRIHFIKNDIIEDLADGGIDRAKDVGVHGGTDGSVNLVCSNRS